MMSPPKKAGSLPPGWGDRWVSRHLHRSQGGFGAMAMATSLLGMAANMFDVKVLLVTAQGALKARSG